MWRRAFWFVLSIGIVLLAVSGSRAQADDSTAGATPVDYALRLGEQTFDPVARQPSHPRGWDHINRSGPDLHLVQLVGPTQDGWLTGLEAAGLAVVQYIHPYTYVVWGDQAAVSRAAADYVRWTGPFVPAYRVLPQWRALPDAPVQVDVLLYRGAGTDQVVTALERVAGRGFGRTPLNNTWEIIGFNVAGNRLRDLAAVPGVYSVQVSPTDGGLRGEMSAQINVNNYDGGNLAFPGYQDWLTGVGLDGSGVIIANVDSGIYDTHPDLVNRMVPCTGDTCGGSATSTHGTHTAGIMAGDGSSGVVDGFGFLRGLGVAPGANLVEQRYSPTYTQPGGMLKLMTQSYNNGASLSGNSWGPSGFPQGYDNDTLQVDIGVRDADPVAAGNQPLSFVLSFMNGNGGTSSQGSPDEAKNIFTIGSTKMQNSNGSQILEIFDLSSNTAHGPALDGRTIPHMVAPGCNVDSSYTATGYGLLCGTSMASPHVSGGVAVFIEYYRNLFGVDPSPALIKAAFTPVAHDLAGYRDADNGILGHPFDSKQGWGRFDLEATVDPADNVLYWDNPVIFDSTGEEWVISVSAANPSEPVRLMLVWTDAPGHGLGGSTPAWNNNLDLVVEADGDTYYGNVFGPDGWSMTGGTPDIKNNTEGVFLPAGTGGAIVTVAAQNINSDGVPNEGDATDQDFALVCYNCASEPDFVLSADPNALSVCKPADAVYTINVGSVAGYTDAVTLSSAVGSFSVNPVTPPGSSTFTVGTAAYPAGSYTIDISGTSTTGTKMIDVDVTVYDGTPGAATLTSPSNGAVDVSVVPTLTWQPAANAAGYDVGIFSSPTLNLGTVVDYALGLTATEWTPTVVLDPAMTYYWAVRTKNPCGNGGVSTVFSFTTRSVPPILLVDDDDNLPDVRATYTAALDAIGASYDIWDTANSDNEPSASELAPYQLIIWFTGDEFGGAAGPGSAGEAALSSHLDNVGGCFWISSQDYLWDRGTTSFMTGYLGMATGTSDVSQTSVNGTRPLFGNYSLTYPFTNYSDRLNPDTTAQAMYIGNQGNAALYKLTTYATSFWGFPFEALPEAGRLDMMDKVVSWCDTFVTTGVDLFADGNR